ncbi:MAG: phytanoyl-CoA dioxygenase family protein [Methylacidiphilales bacterium]|nr:phytanoyl-CoA dioxygenase family protein [Candidatus Methylacidiphilales bacterium]
MSTTTAPTLDIDSEYKISPEQIARFQKNGYIKLKNVLDAEVLEYYGREITRLVLEQAKDYKPLEQRTTYGKAFLQIMNIWQRNEIVKEFVLGKRLARIATALLGTRGVRMYHDQALYKEAGGGYTPWHVDQYYWPLSNEKTVTAWIPLHAVPLENGPLMFSVGSQRIKIGRDLEISDDSEMKIDEQLKLSNLPVDETPFDLGEVSFHLGFTFHRAGPNKLPKAREVMTIIYMDQDMRLIEPKNKNQQNDWDNWCPGAKIGEIINSPLNPVIYSRD